MKHDINSLIGYKIAATDGEVGTVKDFYFDDKAWTIRYLVVETGSWLSSKKVLLSPQAVLPGIADDTIKVALTMDQVKNSPDIDTNLPVSRQQEEVLHLHHSWQNYWDSNFFGGGTSGSTIQANEANGNIDKVEGNFDIHLRSAMEVSGYRIHATDGEIGHVNNFIIDESAWAITTFVIDVKNNLIGGKKVLIDTSHIQAVQWYNAEVFLDVKISDVENSPEYQD